MKMSYWRFAAMVATSTVVMFGLMYLNTYRADHVFWSETRAWMALLMGAAMAAIMLAFMRKMYTKRTLNLAIFAGSAVLFALSLWIVRGQALMDDTDYMKAMIPHHSIAILTSSRARITDPRVRKLADEIVFAQRKEIAEMAYLVDELEAGRRVDALDEAAVAPRLVGAAEAVRSADIARTDLGELDAAEIQQVLGGGAACRFSFAREGAGSILAATRSADGGPARGVVKINGRLVALGARSMSRNDAAARLVLRAPGMGIAVVPADAAADGGPREADAVLRLDSGLEVGYAGYYRCDR